MLIHEKLTTRLNDDLTAQSSRDNAITTSTKLNNLFFFFNRFVKTGRKKTVGIFAVMRAVRVTIRVNKPTNGFSLARVTSQLVSCETGAAVHSSGDRIWTGNSSASTAAGGWFNHLTWKFQRCRSSYLFISSYEDDIDDGYLWLTAGQQRFHPGQSQLRLQFRRLLFERPAVQPSQQLQSAEPAAGNWAPSCLIEICNWRM